MISVEYLLPRVKMAARVSTSAFDDIQLTDLINAAQADLGIAGVVIPDSENVDALACQAVITYCLMHFGTPDNYDRLKRSYDEQKAQLATATGYTDWEGGEGHV